MQDAAVELDSPGDRVRVAHETVHAPLWRAVLAYSGSADVADRSALLRRR